MNENKQINFRNIFILFVFVSRFLTPLCWWDDSFFKTTDNSQQSTDFVHFFALSFEQWVFARCSWLVAHSLIFNFQFSIFNFLMSLLFVSLHGKVKSEVSACNNLPWNRFVKDSLCLCGVCLQETVSFFALIPFSAATPFLILHN